MNRRIILMVGAVAIIAATLGLWLHSAHRPVVADTAGCRIALEQSLARQLSNSGGPDNSKAACVGIPEDVKGRLVLEVAQEAIDRGPFATP